MNVPSTDGLRLRLELPAEASEGSPVDIALHVENVTSEPVPLYLHGRPIAFDIVVRRADGTTLWRRLGDAIIPAILHVRLLQPGEVFTLDTRWTQETTDGAPVPPGDYVLHGELVTEAFAKLLTPPLPLRITSEGSERTGPDRG